MPRLILLAAVLAVLVVHVAQPATQPAVAAPGYHITNLGTFGLWSEAWALNNHGQVTGVSLGTDGVIQPFIWQQGSLSRLEMPRPGIHTLAKDINDAGQITGYSHDALTPARSYIWSAAGITELGLLPAGQSASAAAINGTGDVALTADGLAAVYHNRTLTPLESGGCCASATAINDAGAIAGQAPGFGPPAIWRDGVRQDLPTFGGSGGRAEAINESGWAAGSALTASGESRAFLWDGTLIDLGTLGGPNSTAYDINEAGAIVGASDTGSGNHPRRAFIWAGGVLRDLNDLLPPESGWTLTAARAINDRGQIAGVGILQGQERAFLLNPLSEEARPDLNIQARLDGVTGSDARFLISVLNRSRVAAATAVVLQARLPAAATLVRSDTDTGGCQSADPVVCRVALMPPGTPFAVPPLLTLPAPGRYTLEATVAGNAPDAAPAGTTMRAVFDIRLDAQAPSPARPPAMPCPGRSGCK